MAIERRLKSWYLFVCVPGEDTVRTRRSFHLELNSYEYPGEGISINYNKSSSSSANFRIINFNKFAWISYRPPVRLRHSHGNLSFFYFSMNCVSRDDCLIEKTEKKEIRWDHNFIIIHGVPFLAILRWKRGRCQMGWV